MDVLGCSYVEASPNPLAKALIYTVYTGVTDSWPRRTRLTTKAMIQATAEAAAHAPWDRLRCDALFVRLDLAVRSARAGSDNAAVEASTLRQQGTDHGCKK